MRVLLVALVLAQSARTCSAQITYVAQARSVSVYADGDPEPPQSAFDEAPDLGGWSGVVSVNTRPGSAYARNISTLGSAGMAIDMYTIAQNQNAYRVTARSYFYMQFRIDQDVPFSIDGYCDFFDGHLILTDGLGTTAFSVGPGSYGPISYSRVLLAGICSLELECNSVGAVGVDHPADCRVNFSIPSPGASVPLGALGLWCVRRRR